MKISRSLWLLVPCIFPGAVSSAPPGTNQDESKVPAYTLPDPLLCQDGSKVTDAKGWREKRRPELLRLFEQEVYGQALLGRPKDMTFRVASEKTGARGGKATRREIAVLFTGKEDGPRMDLLLYLPQKTGAPAPVFAGLNFQGNHAATTEPDVALARCWVANDKKTGVADNKANDASRGGEASRWQIDYALEHGYAVATACYGDIDPDFDDGFKNGIHALAPPKNPGDWGSIGAWAWGLSRILDYLETEPQIDAKKAIVMGHSRLGKTALWAGAQDERFAMVISNDSGAGGAALSRRIFGETVEHLNTRFPHWFCDNYSKYNGREADCPVDQHELIALIAPRPVLINSATEDEWADPKGEFLSASAADPVYRLLGTDGIAQKEWPEPGHLLTTRIGYFLRPGAHDVTLDDWKAYVTFADKHVKAAN
ncbi:MAG: alpha/beta hydrolase family protein [Verrucomicrobiales bacterium]